MVSNKNFKTNATQHRQRLKYPMASNGRGLRTSAFRINEKVADHVKELISQSMRLNMRAKTTSERSENACNKDWQTKPWTSHLENGSWDENKTPLDQTLSST